MARYDYIVAIDPDVNESGVACLNVETRQLECSKQRFPAAIDLCIQKHALANDSGKRFVVVIESGWMNRPNWHIQGHNARAAAAIGIHGAGCDAVQGAVPLFNALLDAADFRVRCPASVQDFNGFHLLTLQKRPRVRFSPSERAIVRVNLRHAVWHIAA